MTKMNRLYIITLRTLFETDCMMKYNAKQRNTNCFAVFVRSFCRKFSYFGWTMHTEIHIFLTEKKSGSGRILIKVKGDIFSFYKQDSCNVALTREPHSVQRDYCTFR